jgi:phenylacetate-CoA ligase
MNFRKFILLNYASFRGYKYPFLYKQFLKEDDSGINPDTTINLLSKLLHHCQQSVPYYAELMNQISKETFSEQDPKEYLLNLPILTKDRIRSNFETLKSLDLGRRQWYFNKSGGSTGEPVKLIQDHEYNDLSTAISFLQYYWVGREIGEYEVYLWGSEKDVFQGTMGWKAKFFNFLTNTIYMNAFRMSPDRMREYIQSLNQKQPKLIIAYAQAIYELAKFAEDEKIPIVPQRAIISSAGTLYPWMREKIERIFQCKVFNRYGSREVGNVACERPGYEGLWVAPWGSYVEIVDDNGNLVPAGVEGNILVTSLTNFAMPLLRYEIGDRGILFSEKSLNGTRVGQAFQKVSGRITDNFKTKSGKVIPGEYFIHLIGVVLNDGTIKKFQLIQKQYDLIIVNIVKDEGKIDFKEIIDKIKFIMDEPCYIKIEFLDDILPTHSGKYRYTISEVD